MVEKYKKEFVNKNLKPYDFELIDNQKGKTILVHIGEELCEVPAMENYILGRGLDIITDEVHKKNPDKEKTEIYASITRPSPSRGLERAVNYALILSLLGILFFASQKITGSAISNLSNSVSNIGILVCVIGAIILYLCKLRYK